MPGEIHVDINPVAEGHDRLVVSGQVTSYRLERNLNGVVTFEVPAALADSLAIQGRPDDSHDVFLRALVFAAMEAEAELAIHGNVSLTLLENLETFQTIITSWWPRYRIAPMKADAEVVAEADSIVRCQKEAILAFSGGLDSTYSLFCHQQGLRGRNSRHILDSVFVHGFDIGLEGETYQHALREAGQITTSLASRLIPVRSNLRDFLPSWRQSQPAALAAVLSLFARRYATGIISPSYAYDNAHVLPSDIGSTPLTDRLFSSHTFNIVHDLGRTRVQKTEALRDAEVVWQHMRFCPRRDALSQNCGNCEKCVLQMLCMRAAGKHESVCFSQPLEVQRVVAVQPSSAATLDEWRKRYAHAAAKGLAGHDVFGAMRQVIQQASEAGFRTGPVPALPIGRQPASHSNTSRVLNRLRDAS